MSEFRFRVFSISILLSGALIFSAEAQTPGGVSGATFWFTPESAKDAETAGSLPSGDGTLVQLWTDMSGNNHHASQSVGGNYPAYYLNQTINGHGALRFDGSNDHLPIDYVTLDPDDDQAYKDNPMDSMTVFAIVRRGATSSGDGYIISGDRSDFWTLYSNSSNRLALDAGGRKSPSGTNISTSIGAALSSEQFQIVTADALFEDNGVVDFTAHLYQDGKPSDTTESSGVYRYAYFGGEDPRIFNIGVGSEAGTFPPTSTDSLNRERYYNGDLAELIVYNDRLLDAGELNQVWTYLALKYSILLETRNYLAADSTVVWDRDTTNGKPFHHDVIGIFTDPNSGLQQLASADADSLLIISDDDLSDMYLVTGHNDELYNDLDEGAFGSATFALKKIWKYQLTYLLGSASEETISSLKFDIDSLENAPTGKAGNFFLQIDSDESFPNIDYEYEADFLVDNVLEFINVDLPTGTHYMRLAYMIDTDNDGYGDQVDLDDDNDGISDVAEGTMDTDGDGITNDLDLDSDGDGIPDLWESNDAIRALDADSSGHISVDEMNMGDTDGWHDTAAANTTLDNSDDDGDQMEGIDSIPDYLDLDSDNDGISDLIEGRNFYGLDNGDDGTESGTDEDQDGIYDGFDDDPTTFGNGVAIVLIDTDNDADYNFQEVRSDGSTADNSGADFEADFVSDDVISDAEDDDNDGIADVIDEFDGFGGLSGRVSDWDGDGINNTLDADVDNDGILSESSDDTDGDGMIDSRDLDSDNDGIFDIVELGNSEVLKQDTILVNGMVEIDSVDENGKYANAAEASAALDSDMDGIPDYLDLDSDNDGLSDAFERGNYPGGKFNPGKADRGFYGVADVDSDGIPDGIDSDLAAKGSAYGTVSGDQLSSDASAATTFGFTIDTEDDDNDGIVNGVDEDNTNRGGLPTYYTLAPAGISKDLQIWLRASDSYEDVAGTDLAEDGDSVLYISDISPNYRYGKQETGTSGIGAPTLEMEAINYNDAWNFDGVNDQIPLDYSADYTNDTIGSIIINAVIQVPVYEEGEDNDEKILFSLDYGTFFRCSIENDNGTWRIAWKTKSPSENTTLMSDPPVNIIDNKPHLVTFIYEMVVENDSDTTVTKYIYVDGVQNVKKGDHDERMGVSGSTRFANLGSGSNASEFAGDVAPNRPFLGYVSELTIHRNLDDDERNKLFSYLAIKYGITLSDYYSQEGNLIWDNSSNSNYSDKVIGLAQISTTEFNQSKSGDDTLTFWTRTDSDPADISDGHYYLIGRNSGDPATASTDVPAGYELRSSRVYRFHAKDNSGSTVTPDDFTIEMLVKGVETGLVGSTATEEEIESNLVLLISSDKNFESVEHEITPNTDATDDQYVSFQITGSEMVDEYYFTLGSRHPYPLPLDWISFRAKREKNHVDLKWKTENEVNVSHFDIERSLNTIDFEKIGEVIASNTDGPNEYVFDDQSQTQPAYYRIREVDFDGYSEYSSLARVDGVQETKLLVYPNPAVGFFEYEIQLIPNEPFEVILRDVTGRLIGKYAVTEHNGYFKDTIETKEKGMLFIEVRTGFDIWNQKIIMK